MTGLFLVCEEFHPAPLFLLFQDHFTCLEETEEASVLYEAITNYRSSLVICHESDPAWRKAVLSSRDTLLTLRHMIDDGTDEYKIIMLYKRHLNFKVIKVQGVCPVCRLSGVEVNEGEHRSEAVVHSYIAESFLLCHRFVVCLIFGDFQEGCVCFPHSCLDQVVCH